MSVPVPTEIPSPLDDNYVYYLFLGGIKGQKVTNPNLRNTRHYTHNKNGEQVFFDQRETYVSVYDGDLLSHIETTVHFDIGRWLKDQIPAQPLEITLGDEFTFDENIILQGTLFYPQYQIQGISGDWESPSSYTLPTTLSVSSLVAAGLEAAHTDIRYVTDVAQSNADRITEIHNSKGGFDDTDEQSYNWVMWTYIKKWIIKGFNDFLNGKNDVAKWGENFPTASYKFDFDFDEIAELRDVCQKDGDYLWVNKLKIGNPGLVNSDILLGAGKDLRLSAGDIHVEKGNIYLGSKGNIYYEDESDSDCEDHEFRKVFAFKDHNHNRVYPTMNMNMTIIDYVDEPVFRDYVTLSLELHYFKGNGWQYMIEWRSVDIYTKEAIDNMFMSVSSGEAPQIDLSNYLTESKLDAKMKTFNSQLEEIKNQYQYELEEVKDDMKALIKSGGSVEQLQIDSLKEEITELKKTVENLLSTIKTMNDNDRILFKLVDLYTEISSIKNSLSNIENRVFQLETQKGTIDATNNMLVTLNSAVQQCERTVATYENRVGTLEQGARTTGTNITTLSTRIGALENTNNNTVLPFVTAVPATYATKKDLDDYINLEQFAQVGESWEAKVGTIEGRLDVIETQLGITTEGENEG